MGLRVMERDGTRLGGSRSRRRRKRKELLWTINGKRRVTVRRKRTMIAVIAIEGGSGVLDLDVARCVVQFLVFLPCRTLLEL